MNTETVTVYRGATDKYGNPDKQAHGTATGVFAWGPGTSSSKYRRNDTHGESVSITAEFYVPRGTDLKARDRIRRTNGEEYTVTGHSLWDQVDPFTGHDFGWTVFQVESING